MFINDVRIRKMPRLTVSLGIIPIAGVKLYVRENVALILFIRQSPRRQSNDQRRSPFL